MFTVKATYRNETRKFTFTESLEFPSYESLYHQLYRVFPISPSYYLSKLLFSPSSSPTQRILIGMEAHSADEYNTHILPYQGRTWPGALLRFHVYDETPHKSPGASTSNRLSLISTADSSVGDATASEGASSTTVVESNGVGANYRRRREDERQVFLNRIRERTTSRSGGSPSPTVSSRHYSALLDLPPSPRTVSSRHYSMLFNSPPSPPLSSSNAGSTTSTSRPLPQRPSSDNGSAASAASTKSTRTVRPSLFDLLSQESTSSAHRHSMDVDLVIPPSWRSLVAAADSHMAKRKPALPSSPRDTSAQAPTQELRSVSTPPPPLNTKVWADLIVPPPPILYPSVGVVKPQGETSDVTMASPHEEEVPLLASQSSHAQPMETSQQQTVQQPQQEAASSRAPHTSSRAGPRPAVTHCCSVAQGKAEIKALTEKFMSDFERTMKATIGDDWNLSPSTRRPYVVYPSDHYPAPATDQRTRPSKGIKHSSRAVYHDSVLSSNPPVGPSNGPPIPPRPPVPPRLPTMNYPSLASMSHVSPLVVPPPPPLPFMSTPARSIVPTVVGELTQAAAQKKSKVHRVTCDGCERTGFTGVRFKCLDCYDYDLCSNCIASPSARERHSAQHAFFPIDEPNDLHAFFRARSQRDQDHVIHVGITCDGCHKNSMTGVRHKCLICVDYDLCTACISSPEQREQHDLSHVFFPIQTPGKLDAFHRARDRHIAFSNGRVLNNVAPNHPPMHRNVLCDRCSRHIVGVRHKCLDCPDFDLCSECIAATGVRANHEHGRHQFFEIDRPGEVIVHTVFSGDGEREPQPRPHVSPSRSTPPVVSSDIPLEPAVHDARCNMCDSRILGDRYKCLNCPDFDTCGSCFRITAEQHPEHGFVKVSNPNQLMIRNSLGTDLIHPAKCNVCDIQITGIRYKCMHPFCPDFDMCQACEALPIPLHPTMHPLLKMKTPETTVPNVQRAVQTPVQVINEPATTVLPSSQQPAVAEATRTVEDALLEVFTRFQNLTVANSPLPEPTILEAESSEFSDLPALIPMMQTISAPASTFGSSRPQSVPLSDSSLPGSASHVIPPIAIQPPMVQPAWWPTPGSYNPIYVTPHALATEEHLIDFDETHNEKDSERGAEATLGGLTTPSEAPTSTQSAGSVPRLEPVNSTEWRDLWPELTTMFKHLMTPAATDAESVPTDSNEAAMPGAICVEDFRQPEKAASVHETDTRTAIAGSPLVGEPLLCRPLGVPANDRTDVEGLDFQRRLSDYLSSALHVPTETVDSPAPVAAAAPIKAAASEPAVVPPSPLFASFLSDNNIPNGQIFPPGAEFVKSWRMMNDGLSDWPETTELIFVAGDRLAPHENAPKKFTVGAVKAGGQVEVTAGEMKAPEIVGKYVSYWRLSDGKGREFGHSIWVDISVAELYKATSELSADESESLAASSVIMPHAAPERTSIGASAGAPTLSVTIPSSPPSEDGSFSSSVSLVDLPSPSSDDDDEAYEDSRSRLVGSAVEQEQVREVEYVMLYDSASSEEE